MMKDAIKILKDKDVKTSYQRIAILDFMLNNNIHPSAEMIYRSLVKKIPTLSLTTVYNTLKMFEEKKIVQILRIDKSEQVFDLIIDFHGHFQCIKCGKIIDIPIKHKNEIFDLKEISDKIIDTAIYIKGICKECQEDK